MESMNDTTPFFARFLEKDETQDIVGLNTHMKRRDDRVVSD